MMRVDDASRDWLSLLRQQRQGITSLPALGAVEPRVMVTAK